MRLANGCFRSFRAHAQLARSLKAADMRGQVARLDQLAVHPRERADDCRRLLAFAQQIIEKRERRGAFAARQHFRELPDRILARRHNQGLDVRNV